MQNKRDSIKMKRERERCAEQEIQNMRKKDNKEKIALMSFIFNNNG